MEGKLNLYFKDLEDKIERSYEREQCDEAELKNLIELIKLDDNNDFYKAFTNRISNLIKSKEKKNFFDFKLQKDTNILDYIYNYMDNNLKIITKDDKKEEKKEAKGKEQNNINISSQKRQNKINIQNISNISNKDESKNEKSSSKSSSIFFSIKEKYNLKINKKEDNDINNEKSLDSENKIKNKNINQLSLQNSPNNLDKKKYNSDNSQSNNKPDEREEANIQKIKDIEKLNNDYQNNLIVKNINFKAYDKHEENKIQSYEDCSGLIGTSFENDSIFYIFSSLHKLSSSENCSIFKNFTPPIDKINSIFSKYKKYNLFTLTKIEFDFLVLDLKISDLIDFLIDIYPKIHPNSKLSFFSNDKFFTLDDLMNIRNQNEEYIDIIGEIGVNIFNEEEKCKQLIKYAKLIHNINQLIKINAKELPYLLDLLKFNGNNKKLLLFISDGPFSSFKNTKNNKFLTMQKMLHVDSLLIFRNRNFLFRTKLLEKVFKKYQKDNIKSFNDEINNEFEKVIKESFKSDICENAVKKLSNIGKRIKYMKKKLYEYCASKDNFISLCNKAMKNIYKNEIRCISKDNFENAKKKFYKFITPITEIKTNYYIIYDEDYEENELKNLLIKYLKEQKIPVKEGNNMEIIRENERNINKIIIFFVNDTYFFNIGNYIKILNLKDEYQINKYNHIYFILETEENINKNLDHFKAIFDLNFSYILFNEELKKIIEIIIKEKEKNQEFIDYLNNEIIYKLIIDNYIKLFGKSIYDKNTYYSKDEQLFIKINQDIQFLQNFGINNAITLNPKTKIEINKLLRDKIIEELINNFINDKQILVEIKNLLIKFENEIDEINDNNNRNRNSSNEKNNISNDENNKNKDNKKEQNLLNSREEIIECEKLLSEKREKKELKEIDGKDERCLLIIEQIRESIRKSLTDDICFVIYIMLQKSIINKFEHLFNEKYPNFK